MSHSFPADNSKIIPYKNARFISWSFFRTIQLKKPVNWFKTDRMHVSHSQLRFVTAPGIVRSVPRLFHIFFRSFSSQRCLLDSRWRIELLNSLRDFFYFFHFFHPQFPLYRFMYSCVHILPLLTSDSPSVKCIGKQGWGEYSVKEVILIFFYVWKNIFLPSSLRVMLHVWGTLWGRGNENRVVLAERLAIKMSRQYMASECK